MILTSSRVALELITPELARRIVTREERPGDDWHPEYPFVDELDPLRSLAGSSEHDPTFRTAATRSSSTNVP